MVCITIFLLCKSLIGSFGEHRSHPLNASHLCQMDYTGSLPCCTNTLNDIFVCGYVCVNDIYTDSGAAARPDMQQGSPSVFVLKSLSS